MTEQAKQQFLQHLSKEHEAFVAKCPSHALFMKKAFDHFLEVGFCEKKPSAEGYIPLHKLYRQEISVVTKQTFLDKVLPECSGSYLVLKNGKVDLKLSVLPQGCIIEALESADSPYRSFVYAQVIASQKTETDPFSLLCQAHLKGALIIIPEGLKLQAPLQIIDLSDESEQLPVSNAFIYVAQGAEAEFILTPSSTSMASSYIQLSLDEGAKARITRLQSHSTALRFDKMVVNLKKEAELKVVDLCEPSSFSRFSLHVNHLQKGASSSFYALSLIEAKQDYHICTCFEHQAPETSSSQLVKTVLRSKAKGAFSGKIYVHQEALLTQSYQKHATLMLGDHGMICSRPNLRILADDVKASHGATIAGLDASSLFYLKTRGLNETVAKQLLLQAFCEGILEHINIPSIKAKASQLLLKESSDEYFSAL